jgi:hypothetical protein
MRWPQRFNVLVNFYQCKPVSANSILQWFWKFRHVLVALNHNKLDLGMLESEVVRNTPLALMRIISKMPARKTARLGFYRTVMLRLQKWDETPPWLECGICRFHILGVVYANRAGQAIRIVENRFRK